MTTDLEAPRPLNAPGTSDAVTVAFADAGSGVCGVARVGRTAGPDGAPVASGLGLLFADGDAVAVRAQGGAPCDGDGWGGAEAAGVRTEVVEPHAVWRISFAALESADGFDLEVRALSTPAIVTEDTAASRLGGMQGYEQIVRVSGHATVDGAARPVAGIGQRGHAWGAPDWERVTLARTVGVWTGAGPCVALTALRPASVTHHAGEAVAASLFRPTESGLTPLAIEDPRLSTTYDAEGRQRAAGLELYVGAEDDYPVRGAGELWCGTTLDLGHLRYDCAFFRWRVEGDVGVGRYDVLRRV